MWCVANDAFHNPPVDEDAPWLAVEVHTGVKEDAEFIANAPADVAHLLAVVEAISGHLELAERMCEANGTGKDFAVVSVEQLRAAISVDAK